ncbi:methyl-accepting chemotaxis protein [Marinospirillum insulare]|uniref:Methyl-accepting chemotaxis protein n=1 Tax=Marinospirillum insulare TaxID=217169 RepID=A0ABQ6A274_9GAMM|nr:methyl-accepting chemotaxis protein [Marinospirillum insulare]GLR64338.1 methyl-accepting chemotaxis protein [Marinospirillum insulare]
MLKRLKVKSKLFIVISFMALLLLIIGMMGLSGMKKSNTALGDVYNDRLRPTLLLAEIQYLMQQNIIQLNLASMHDPRLDEHVLHDHPITMHTDIVRENIKQITQLWTEFMASSLTERESLLAADYAKLRGDFTQQGLVATIKLLESGFFELANVHMIEKTNPLFLSSVGVAEQLLELQRQVSSDLFENQQASYSTAQLIAVVMIVVGILIAAFLGWLLISVIVNPLNRAVNYFQEISKGNLNNTIVIEHQDEIGEVLTALQAMQDHLRGLVTEIKSSVDSINTASQEIATGNVDLSQRTEEQASSLEETAASLEELTSTVRQNADNARQANQLAQNASSTAGEGGEKSRQVITTMEAISDSSNKIANIIKLIDDIAFQTNILALNAAVEAARAGDQGRGFAVVAEEVRSLAQRSAAAAKEISDLITHSVATVSQGAELVKETGSTIEAIVGSVQRVTDIIGEISAASDEQSQGIEQVNQAVTQMDDVTQQNAALVEEAAAAAESLQEQAGLLSDSVAIFQVDTAKQPTKASKPAKSLANKPASQPLAKPAKRLAAKPIPKPKKFDDDEWEEF